MKIVTEIPASQRGFDFCGKRISIIDHSLFFEQNGLQPELDVVILSRNPRIYIKDICKAFRVKQIVIDGSVPPWKARLWKRDCDSLHLPCYDVGEKGAFVMNLR
jgi:competence protein ComEC